MAVMMDMELENIVANTVLLKAREGTARSSRKFFIEILFQEITRERENPKNGEKC